MSKLFYFCYGLFLLIFTLFSYLFVDPNLFYLNKVYTGFAYSNRLSVSVFYVISVLIFFFFYFVFLKKIKLKQIKTLPLISVVVLFFSYPAILSYDIFNYISTSKVLFLYKENPYIIMPIEFINEPMLAFTRAVNKTALYGPVWIILTGVPYVAGLGNFILTLFSFKLLVVLFYFGTIALIRKITKNIYPLILFALNPLVLIETLVSGHNDIVMMFFALLSFYLLSKKKFLLPIIFIILSILIKYATLFLLPIFIYSFYKTIKKQFVNWHNVYFYSALSMLVIFLLSIFRGEIYPWYTIWFISFAFLVPQRTILLAVSIAFSFGMLFTYVSFMYLGTYFSPTPYINLVLTFIPPFIALVYISFRNNLWLKKLRLS